MPYDTYNPRVDNSGNSRAGEYKYDPQKKAWVKCSWFQSTVNWVKSVQEKKSSSGASNSTSNSYTATSNGTSKVNSQAKADKEYIEVEYNTLEGELSLIVSSKTLRIKSGDTINIEGLGKYLSGLYYVSAVKRTIDSSGGYSHTLTVIKTGFGSTYKSAQAVQNSASSTTRPTQSSNPTSTSFAVGDKVKFLTVESNKYTYANASDGVPVPKWVTEKTHTVDGISTDGKRVRLKEIWSWTYAKFLKKV